MDTRSIKLSATKLFLFIGAKINPLILRSSPYSFTHYALSFEVWIGTLSHGPTGHCLNATFKNAESYGFQGAIQ